MSSKFILEVCETDRETGDVTVRNYEFDSITSAEIATRLLIDITEYHNGSDFESTITNQGIGA
jgi:predicted transcriptional regulator